ncbi:MAG: cellulase family glycosylhydrolase [Anaerolineae bacterium]
MADRRAPGEDAYTIMEKGRDILCGGHRHTFFLIGLLLVVLVMLGFLIHQHTEAIRLTLSHWTGEEDLKEQIKGTLALAYLKLTHRASETDPFTPMPHTGISPYGVNTFLEQEAEPAKVDRSLQAISDAGFYWIRQQFPWEDIEIAGKGDFWDHRWDKSAWEKYDYIVDAAEKHDLEIIARLDNPPPWSRSVGDAPGWELAPPDAYADFGDFVYAVVSRYRGRVRYYQIWNEPNIYPEWGEQPVDPEAYTELLKVAYRRAKEADPNCVILAAGLAQTTEEGGRNMSDLLYLERMYRAGAKDHFDIMGAMVYGLWTGPYDRRAAPHYTNFSRAQLIREIMVRHGDADKPIWATEVGWNSVPESFPEFARYGRVTEDRQATYAVEAYRRAEREWPWMGVMNYWFFRRPSDAEKDQPWYYFRMMEPDFTPLPVYDAMSQLANRPPAVNVGYHQEDHWALHYGAEGDEEAWRQISDEEAVLGAYALGDKGSSLDFYFEGTDLSLVVRHDGAPSEALRDVDILIDGEEKVGENYGISPQLLTDVCGQDANGEGTVVIPIARGLTDDRHRVHLRVKEGTLSLDGLIVQRSNGVGLHTMGMILGLVIVGGAALVTGSARREESTPPRNSPLERTP